MPALPAPRHSFASIVGAVAGGVLACASAVALATAQRTFVASSGNDANATNNCSIALPCRSFAAALGVTQ